MLIAPKTIVGVGCNPARIAAGRQTLKRHGFNVVTATSVPAAIAVCTTLAVDAVVVGRSIPPTSAHALIQQLRHDGGPPVLYLDNDADDADIAPTTSNQHPFLTRQFLRMLRTVLMGDIDQNTLNLVKCKAVLRRLWAWWVALLASSVIAFMMNIRFDDGNPLRTAGLLIIALSIICAVGCLQSQLSAIVELQSFDIDPDRWYPRIALGIVFLLPGILVELMFFIFAIHGGVRRKLATG